MSSVQNGWFIEDGTAAHVRKSVATFALERDLERQRVRDDLRTTDDLVLQDRVEIAACDDRQRQTRKHRSSRGGCNIQIIVNI